MFVLRLSRINASVSSSFLVGLLCMLEKYQNNLPRYQWLNETEVASLIGISVYTLRQHRHKGIGLPYVKYGRSVRYSIADISSYLESRKITFNKV